LRDGRPASVFLGHTEGITYLSADLNHNIVSNAKDQTAKIFDLRKALPGSTNVSNSTANVRKSQFDYRFMPYRSEWNRKHPKDCSIQTLRGHSVLQTLIRIHFLPSNPSIVYSGSADGKVRYWNIVTGDVLHILDCSSFLRAEMPFEIETDTASAMFLQQYLRRYNNSRRQGECVVRDVAVHPFDDTLVASCFSTYQLDPNEGASIFFGPKALIGSSD